MIIAKPLVSRPIRQKLSRLFANLGDSEAEKIFVTLSDRPQKVIGSLNQSGGVSVIGTNGAVSGTNRGIHGSVNSSGDGSTGVRG
jgi:hypothetical protein